MPKVTVDGAVPKKKKQSAAADESRPLKRKKLRLAERVGVNTDEIVPGAAAPPAAATTSAAAAAAPSPPPKPAGRPWTVTLALPGSIADNAQSHELRSYLVGQVARAAAIFNVDEIVIFQTESASAGARTAPGGAPRTDGCVFMARLLQYLECPQYLRRQIFPMHPDLRFVGLLAPLDAPHHLRIDEECAYREGVVSEREAKGGGSLVYTGLRKEQKIDRTIEKGTRVTVRLPCDAHPGHGVAVAPREPREAAGMYWGYSVRLAESIEAVWSGCPYEGGYDMSIGTSEHGTNALDEPSFALPRFDHLLVVFGGVEGLEPAVAAEENLAAAGVHDPASLFDHYLNLCPRQGSRTIRSEEAVLVGMAALRPHVERAQAVR